MLSLQNQRQPKTTPLVDDYEISDTVLGLGINGKVVQCTNRRTKQNFALKVLLDNEKARREVDLHWRVSGCKHIVNIIDVYENTYSGRKCLLVVMEWYVKHEQAKRAQVDFRFISIRFHSNKQNCPLGVHFQLKQANFMLFVFILACFIAWFFFFLNLLFLIRQKKAFH